jgi:hypothetical protein
MCDRRIVRNLIALMLMLGLSAITQADTIDVPTVVPSDIVHNRAVFPQGVIVADQSTAFATTGFTAAIDDGDTLRLRIEPPQGTFFRVKVGAGNIGQVLVLVLAWEEGGEVPGYITSLRPTRVTFEGLTGGEPELSAAGNGVAIANEGVRFNVEMAVDRNFNFRAMIVEFDETIQSLDPLEVDYVFDNNAFFEVQAFYPPGSTADPQDLLKIDDLAPGACSSDFWDDCQVVTGQVCDANGGVWAGPGSTCPPEPTPCIWDNTSEGGGPNGEVDVFDFFALLQRWGPCPE